MIKVVHATVKHLVEFYNNAREIDLEEVKVASGIEFKNMPLPHFLSTYAIVRGESEEVLGIAGIDYNGTTSAVIWLLMTHAVEEHKMEFLRWSKRYLRDKILQRYDEVFNSVYVRNTLHVSWLDWLGAEWVYKGENLSTFVLRRKEEK